ncbi:type II toxin-antitoxin system VapB family antitoxin [Vallicoccus soli]|nr:type II toxin-antitoxin system VapB family antitoxin [Vallicoccus soli]
MNIKNPETEALARQVAARTGETLTGAITQALRERLERIDARPGGRDVQATIDAVKAITGDLAKRLEDGPGSADIDALLYDERGLPR